MNELYTDITDVSTKIKSTCEKLGDVLKLFEDPSYDSNKIISVSKEIVMILITSVSKLNTTCEWDIDNAMKQLFDARKCLWQMYETLVIVRACVVVMNDAHNHRLAKRMAKTWNDICDKLDKCLGNCM